MRASKSVFLHLALGCALGLAPVSGAGEADGPSAVHVERARKIADSLEIGDQAKLERVGGIIARQYHDLSMLHDERDRRMKQAREADDSGALAAARDFAATRQLELHYAYLALLAVELTPEQVEGVKDGMTYGVVPLTFRVYREMVPDLDEGQKRRILAWLIEAREHAMDAGSSREKHAWFGKYKGRINNYLSAAGVDLKQAEREMYERRKAGGSGP